MQKYLKPNSFKYGLLAGLLCFSNALLADERIPTTEKEFVAAVSNIDKASILAQFGEPARRQDLTGTDGTTVTASVWQYHNINTSALDGKPFETTELDFVEDKVVVVVFMNGDGVATETDAKPIRITRPDM